MLEAGCFVGSFSFLHNFLGSLLSNVDNMKWMGFGATNLSHTTKLISSKLAKKSDNTQLFYIKCYVAFLL